VVGLGKRATSLMQRPRKVTMTVMMIVRMAVMTITRISGDDESDGSDSMMKDLVG
jgi:hypothetical protein